MPIAFSTVGNEARASHTASGGLDRLPCSSTAVSRAAGWQSRASQTVAPTCVGLLRKLRLALWTRRRGACLVLRAYGPADRLTAGLPWRAIEDYDQLCRSAEARDVLPACDVEDSGQEQMFDGGGGATGGQPAAGCMEEAVAEAACIHEDDVAC